VNNEFKYGMQGLLIAIAFFVVLQVGSFLLIFSQELQQENDLPPGCGTVSATEIKNVKGRQLFSQNCASCHAIQKQLTGPALMGIEDRVPDRKLLYQWVKNSESVIKSGNLYFVDLYSRFDKIPMNKFPSLSNEDIDNILEYIKEYEKNVPLYAPSVITCYLHK
jgi:cytochrome c2